MLKEQERKSEQEKLSDPSSALGHNNELPPSSKEIGQGFHSEPHQATWREEFMTRVKGESEGMWFKPQTWIALSALILTTSFAVIPWIFNLGQFNAKTATKDDLSKFRVEMKTYVSRMKKDIAAMIYAHENKSTHAGVSESIRRIGVTRIEFITLKSKLDLFKLSQQTIKERQSRELSRSRERHKAVMEAIRKLNMLYLRSYRHQRKETPNGKGTSNP